MDEFTDNLISEYKLSQWEKDFVDSFPRVGKYIPITTYDMVQTGYPKSNHGEMIARYHGEQFSDGTMGPSKGMWCKVEDVVALIEQIKPDYFKND